MALQNRIFKEKLPVWASYLDGAWVCPERRCTPRYGNFNGKWWWTDIRFRIPHWWANPYQVVLKSNHFLIQEESSRWSGFHSGPLSYLSFASFRPLASYRGIRACASCYLLFGFVLMWLWRKNDLFNRGSKITAKAWSTQEIGTRHLMLQRKYLLKIRWKAKLKCPLHLDTVFVSGRCQRFGEKKTASISLSCCSSMNLLNILYLTCLQLRSIRFKHVPCSSCCS